jgi:hypothetical protein
MVGCPFCSELDIVIGSLQSYWAKSENVSVRIKNIYFIEYLLFLFQIITCANISLISRPVSNNFIYLSYNITITDEKTKNYIFLSMIFVY